MLLRRVSIVSVFLLTLGGVVALANPNPWTPEIAQSFEGKQPQHRQKQKLIEELDLTPEQEQQLQAIHRQYKGEIEQQLRELQQAKQELGKLMAGTAPVREVRLKYGEVEGLQQQLGELRFESTLAMREVMTTEQRSRFNQLMQQRQEDLAERWADRRGEGH